MAQETAGTIGIPVIKNEILPALDNYARRQERYERLKAAQEAKAAEAAAKKAAEDAKFVPKFESSSGDMFGHITKANSDNRIKGALDIYRDPNAAQQTKMLTAYEANRMNMDDADLDKQLTAKILKTTEDLKNRYRKVGTDYAYQWGKQQKEYRTPEQFAQEVRSNPDLIDFDAIGKTAKEYKASDYSYRDKDGVTKTIKMSPLFEYKLEKDPFVGTEVPKVVGVNGVEAQALIESNPDIKEAFDVWTKNRANQYQTNRTFYDPTTGSPMMIRPELAEDQAAKEFMEQTFGKYGTVKYGQQFSMPRKGGGGGGGKTPVNIESNAGLRSVDFPVYNNNGEVIYGADGKPKTQQATVGNAKTDRIWSFSKEYNFGANVPVYLMQNPEDIGLDDGVMNMYLAKKPDGAYTLKTGFKYSNPIKSSVYFAKEDIKFYGQNKGSGYIVKKGTPLTNETALNLIRQGRKKEVDLRDGYEVTANMAVPYEIEESDTKAGITTKERVRPSVKLFIPEENAGAIKGHINLEKQKAKSFGSEEISNTEDYTIFSK